ncbi:hypothetical protein ACIQ9E_21225 [Streptomyces sp. NPDC094448]|uniref:hypothetical protein n=1 Tax=Streptomyces sp. NPDC094448 TaxID=3366063 RepID=UPI00381E4D34
MTTDDNNPATRLPQYRDVVTDQEEGPPVPVVPVEEAPEDVAGLVRVLLPDAHQDGLGGVRAQEVPAVPEDLAEDDVLKYLAVMEGEGTVGDTAAEVQEADPFGSQAV